MTTTVRSVDVRLNAHVDAYIVKMKLAGQATDQVFGRSRAGIRDTNAELAKSEERLKSTTRSTREYSLETAIADERAKRLRQSLRDEARAAVDAESGLKKTTTETRRVGDSSERAGRQIDRFSGRLALIAQASAVIGPTLIPLGAAGIPALAALTSQVGTLAGALGVGVLAFKGMGDALKAVNKYDLEPTAANLQEMRVEMEKLGPDGAHFVRFVDDLSSQLSTLQMAAREGLLPGVEDGIEALLPMLPRVRSIITDIASAMGDLAADAGADLAGPEWRGFFDYLESDAGPLLTDFGRTLGNFANGFANLLVGFGPLTSDFSDGLLGMSEAFEQWSANLDDNESFQAFLDYLAEAGPNALAFLDSLVGALVALLRAAAPVGDVVLPTLTAMLDVIGALASTDLGTTFFAAAAGMAVYSRAAGLVAAANTRMATSSLLTWRQTKVLGAGIGVAALSMTDLDEKAGLSNTAMMTMYGTMAGPWGVAAGAAIGLTMDLAASNDDLAAAIEKANDAMAKGAGDAEIRRNMEAVQTQIEETKDSLSEGFFSMDKPKQMFAGLNEVLGIFGPTIEDGERKISDLADGLGTADFATRQMADALGMTAQQFRVASGNAEAFTGALARMAGFLDKRAAFRQYNEDLKKFTDSLKNGFQPGNVKALDAVASSILQVASQIKNVDNRADFLAGARDSLIKLAGTGPKAQEAISRITDEFVRLGLMDPVVDVDADTKGADGKLDRTRGKADDLGRRRPNPRVDADTKGADNKLSTTDRLLLELAGRRPNPKITVNNSQAKAAISETARMLARIDGTGVTTYVRTIRTAGNIGGGPVEVRAGGGQVRGPGTTTSDSIPALLSDREYVIKAAAVDRYGVDFFDRANAMRLADGGQARNTPGGGRHRPQGTPTLDLFDFVLGREPSELRDALADLRKSLRATGTAWTKQMQAQAEQLMKLNRGYRAHSEALDELEKAQRSYRDDIASTYRNDVFGNGLAGLKVGLEADTNDADAMTAALKKAAAKGLDGDLADALAASGDLNTAQQLAGLSRAEIARYERLYKERQDATQQLGSYAAAQMYGDDIRRHQQWLARNERATERLIDVLNGLPRRIENGARQGNGDRNTGTRLRVRAGVR